MMPMRLNQRPPMSSSRSAELGCFGGCGRFGAILGEGVTTGAGGIGRGIGAGGVVTGAFGGAVCWRMGALGMAGSVGAGGVGEVVADRLFWSSASFCSSW